MDPTVLKTNCSPNHESAYAIHSRYGEWILQSYRLCYKRVLLCMLRCCISLRLQRWETWKCPIAAGENTKQVLEMRNNLCNHSFLLHPSLLGISTLYILFYMSGWEKELQQGNPEWVYVTTGMHLQGHSRHTGWKPGQRKETTRPRNTWECLQSLHKVGETLPANL